MISSPMTSNEMMYNMNDLTFTDGIPPSTTMTVNSSISDISYSSINSIDIHNVHNMNTHSNNNSINNYMTNSNPNSSGNSQIDASAPESQPQPAVQPQAQLQLENTTKSKKRKSKKASSGIATAFDCPTSLNDRQWLWRDELQRNRGKKSQLSHLSLLLQQSAINGNNSDNNSGGSDHNTNHGQKNHNHKNTTTNHPNKPAIACRSRRGSNGSGNGNGNGSSGNSSNGSGSGGLKNVDSMEIHINCQQLLKFGCPKHDLAPALINHGYSCPDYLICNGYSVDCNNCNFINKNNMYELKSWNFEQLGVSFRRFLSAEKPLSIEIKCNNNNSNNTIDKKDISKATNTNSNSSLSASSSLSKKMEFEILRTGEGVFPKKFRPGMYKFDGNLKSKLEKQQERNNKMKSKSKKRGKNRKDKSGSNDNKLGTWFEGKLFYIRQSDSITLNNDESGSIKFVFDLHCNLSNKKNKDGLNDIIGGIGLCQLNGKSQKYGIRNCLLLRSEETELFQVLQKSHLRVFVDANKLDQLKQQKGMCVFLMDHK